MVYTGYKEINKNGATGEITIIDTRELGPEKEIRVAQNKQYYGQKILEAVPQYKQNNIALGLYTTEEEDRYLKIIEDYRFFSNNDEEKINNCKTLEELDALNLPY